MNFICEPGLKLYLPLYELDGASFASRDAYKHLCTVTGATWRLDGRYFGGDDTIALGAGSSLNISGAISALIWYRKSNTTHYDGLFSLYTSGAESKFGLADYNTDWFQVHVANSGGSKQTISGFTTVIDTIYCAGVSITDTGDWIVYLDGQVERTGSITDPVQAGLSASYVGQGKWNNSWRKLIGFVGEVWLWSRVLTPIEFAHVYLATKWRYR